MIKKYTLITIVFLLFFNNGKSNTIQDDIKNSIKESVSQVKGAFTMGKNLLQGKENLGTFAKDIVNQVDPEVGALIESTQALFKGPRNANKEALDQEKANPSEKITLKEKTFLECCFYKERLLSMLKEYKEELKKIGEISTNFSKIEIDILGESLDIEGLLNKIEKSDWDSDSISFQIIDIIFSLNEIKDFEKNIFNKYTENIKTYVKNMTEISKVLNTVYFDKKERLLA